VNPNTGPGCYNNFVRANPLKKMQQSSVFRSQSQKDTQIARNIVDCDIETQIKWMGNPGPGAYDLSTDIGSGRTQRSKVSLYKSPTHQKLTKRMKLQQNMELNEEADAHRLVSHLRDFAHSSLGPGAYDVTQPIEPPSFFQNPNHAAFHNNTLRFPPDMGAQPSKSQQKFTKKFSDIRLPQNLPNTYKNQAATVKKMGEICSIAPPFQSSEARIPKDKNIERDLPGPGVYLQSQWNLPHPATHGAFRSQTDRKLLPDDSKGKGTLAGFMIDIVDNIKDKQRTKVQSLRESVCQRPANVISRKINLEYPSFFFFWLKMV
jgi:hypothetical protein